MQPSCVTVQHVGHILALSSDTALGDNLKRRLVNHPSTATLGELALLQPSTCVEVIEIFSSCVFVLSVGHTLLLSLGSIGKDKQRLADHPQAVDWNQQLPAYCSVPALSCCTTREGWLTIHCFPAILFTVQHVGPSRIPASSSSTTLSKQSHGNLQMNCR
jgi:hypothetical protein